jgi:hypothetical protein
VTDRFETYNCAFRPGDKVSIGNDFGIQATVEEVIMARGTRSPLYLVEYWHDGHLVSRRLHEDDLRNPGRRE